MVILNLQRLSNFGHCLVGFGEYKLEMEKTFSSFAWVYMHCARAVCMGASGIDLRVMIDIEGPSHWVISAQFNPRQRHYIQAWRSTGTYVINVIHYIPVLLPSLHLQVHNIFHYVPVTHTPLPPPPTNSPSSGHLRNQQRRIKYGPPVHKNYFYLPHSA